MILVYIICGIFSINSKISPQMFSSPLYQPLTERVYPHTTFNQLEASFEILYYAVYYTCVWQGISKHESF